MYTDVLADAFRTSDNGLTGATLVEQVVDRRIQMLKAQARHSSSAYDLLALEVAYDVALIQLCGDVGVATNVADFANPLVERARVERVLRVSRGLDLSALTRQ